MCYGYAMVMVTTMSCYEYGYDYGYEGGYEYRYGIGMVVIRVMQ